MEYRDIVYQPGNVARLILNRPQYLNAQSRRMIEEMDHAFATAAADPEVHALVLSGKGKSFSAGHDLGTPEEVTDREERGYPDFLEVPLRYNRSRGLYLEATMRWRNFPKPTIAMVHGHCIFGGYMFAASMDLIFAADDAMFLPSHLQYFSAPWDLGARKAKEVLYESRFIPAPEALSLGLVNRIYDAESLEAETIAYAERVAENDPFVTRMVKFSVNHMQDGMGFTTSLEAAYQTYYINAVNSRPGSEGRRKRLPGVGRAVELLKRGIPSIQKPE